MYQGRIARKVALMVLFSLALQVADPQTVKGAPPFHANRDKERNEKDNTGGRRRGPWIARVNPTPATNVNGRVYWARAWAHRSRVPSLCGSTNDNRYQ